jgi:hypothetical protein
MDAYGNTTTQTAPNSTGSSKPGPKTETVSMPPTAYQDKNGQWRSADDGSLINGGAGYDPNNAGVIHAGGGDGIGSDGSIPGAYYGGRTGGETNVLAPGTRLSGVEMTRINVGFDALAMVGSTGFENLSTTNDPNFGVGDNKCNLFVFTATTQAGASPGLPNPGGTVHQLLGGGPYPPGARDWGNPNFDVQGWQVLTSGQAPSFGDVASFDGHVGIVTRGSGMTTSAPVWVPVVENNWGFRSNQTGVVFRRWVGP